MNVVPLALSFVASLVAVQAARVVATRWSLYDRPNERSSHLRPTPRVGGVGLMLALLAVLGWAPAFEHKLLLLCCLACIAAVGLVDDLKPLPSWLRMLAQLAVATTYVLLAQPESGIALPGAASLHMGWPASIFWVLWLAWMVNLFNFMDGLDGLAGSQAAIAGGFFFLFGAGDIPPMVSLALVGACAGFLVWNWPPAKVFMGDSGSTAVGFLLGVLAMDQEQPGGTSGWLVGVLALFPFVFDATITLCRRLWQREKVWAAHRSHLYQLPQLWGWSHVTITSRAVGLMLACVVLARVYQLGFESAWLGWSLWTLLVGCSCVGAVVIWDRSSILKKEHVGARSQVRQ